MNQPPDYSPTGTPPSPQAVEPPLDGPQDVAAEDSSTKGQQYPYVSVVVLNYNGLRHLEECYRSLLALDYPKDRLELILTDNGSSDGSLDYMREHFTTVRLVETGSNLGFAAGNNFGAEAARGEYVAFLNNDTRVKPDWLSELVKGLLAGKDAGVVCTSSLMLDWAGKRIDFLSGGLNFHGFGFQPSYGLPLEGQNLAPRDLLFACGGSMLIRRDVFLEVGGFDPDYFAFFEDVDLGWRLWMLGYRITLTPTAVTYHRHHGTAGEMANHRVQVLYERNALYTIYKNYEEANLNKILPAALLLLGQRAVRLAELGGINFSDYDLASTTADPSPAENLHRNAVATLIAVDEFRANLDKFQHKREWLQARRKRSDDELLAMFGQPGRIHLVNHKTDAPYAAAHFGLLHEFGIESLWSHLPREVLVISPDVLPVGDIPASGSGIRAWALGKGLESRGHRVRFTMPKAALTGREDQLPAEYVAGAWTPETLQSIVDALAPDVVVSCGWPNLTWLPRANLPVALDLAGPHLLERAYQQYRDVETNAEEKLAALRRADFYTCISTRQRYYFTGWLAQAGVRVEDIPSSLAVIPYSLDPVQPEHHNREGEEIKFVYGGIFLPWQNAAPALLAVAAALEEAGTGTVEVIGGKHPFHAVDTGNFGPLIDKLATMPRVKMSGLLPHDELVERYTQADVAVDLMLPNAERELAFPSRTVHYFWCGLPVIHAEFSEVASFIREYEAGWVVPHGDEGALRDVVMSILANPEITRVYGQRAQKLARECFSWDKTVNRLDTFVRNPYIRAERTLTPQETEPAANPAQAGGILITAAERELPPKAQRLQARRRTPQRQAAARSISLLRELLPVTLSRKRTSKVTGRKCFALSELTEGHSHGQRFLSPRSGLSGVRVEIGTFGRRNTSRLVLHLRVHPAAATDLYTLEVPVHNIRDGQPLLFRFPPIDDSWNRWFYLVAECPDGVPGDAVTLLASTRPGHVKGQRYVDGLPTTGSLLIDLEFDGENP